MAIHTKTVEYPFTTRVTSLTAATRYDFTAITLYIPETTSRTFRSVRVQVTCRDTVTTATSLTSPLVGIKLGATAFSDTTLGNPAGNSGESQSYIFERDVTSYFVSNFGAGASQTCQVGVQFSGVATINITAKLIITYECDDQQTRVKTVRIPLDSGTGALTATLAEIGTNQIPNLSTFLPESSVTIRSVWFELHYNEFTAGTANDAQLGMQVNSETENLTGAHESGMGSSCFGLYIWVQTGATWVSSGAVAAFKLRSSNITTASTFNHVGIILCVTYEYDHTNSSTILNSLKLGMENIDVTGSSSSDEDTALAMEIYIEEPATITMVQSGALVYWHSQGNNNSNIKIGAGSARGYTEAALLFCGHSAITQRIDSGGAGGSALTLARGLNRIYWAAYSTSIAAQTGFFGFVFLNYTSGKASGGDGTHNKSTCWSVADSQASGTSRLVSSAQNINIPETNWWNNNLSMVSNVCNAGASLQPLSLMAESNAGEFSAGGFEVVGRGLCVGEGENGVVHRIVPIHNYFDRWYGDPQTYRMDVEGSRRWRVFDGCASTMPLMLWFTYHCITKSVAGDISGSGGGTVTIHAIRDVDGRREEIANTSRSGNGAFSMTVMDDVDNVKAIAREDATHVGSSERGAAT